MVYSSLIIKKLQNAGAYCSYLTHEKNHTFFSTISVINNSFENTVKREYNDHPMNTKFVAVVDGWLLFML